MASDTRKARKVTRGRTAPVVPGARQPKWTPPCVHCRLPLLAGETRCPRCKAGVPVL